VTVPEVERFAAARRKLARWALERDRALLAARAAGATLEELAGAAGVSRQAVHALVRDAEQRRALETGESD
jgi:hypothetical protein